MIFACFMIPLWSQVRMRLITRAISWLSTGYLITFVIQSVLLFGGLGGKRFTPPLARLIPGDKGSMQVILADHSTLFGLPSIRSVLYTPDPPILGLCALFCILICLAEPNKTLRKFAIAGAIVALLCSASRSAMLLLPLALVIGHFLQSGWFRQIALWLASLTFLISSILSLTLADLRQGASGIFNRVRDNAGDSTQERAFVVRETLKAWQESPWVGWGVIRGRVNLYEDVYITLGSFSTYSAVLYLHGIIGFAIFVMALVLTLWSTYQPAINGQSFFNWAFSGLIALYIACNATPLSWMAVNIWFFFLWLGSLLSDYLQDRTIVQWEHLRGNDDWQNQVKQDLKPLDTFEHKFPM
ncbi:MAG: O-antigen ligase family protein, partial [Leptolyngbyaceae cyanobacterium bins.59]|nr:O-antigen ligase family protein [Leptolyngbyaceae cyanobacterium bins.59]